MGKYHRYLLSASFIIVLFFLLFVNLEAQIKGEPPAKQDTAIIFHSPRPLVNPEENQKTASSIWGVDLVFSGNGFGAGLMIEKGLSSSMSLVGNILFSGARNTDEFEQNVFNPVDSSWLYIVPNKVNRLFMAPLMVGINQYLFQNSLDESLRPYVSAGIGATFILSDPYEREFFNAFKYSRLYVRPAAYLGVGLYFGGSGGSATALNIRYYYIPFGGAGLESIRGKPITDFGGLFLSLTLANRL